MLKYHCDMCDEPIGHASNNVSELHEGTPIGLYGHQGPLRACDDCFNLYESSIQPIQEELARQEEAAKKAKLEMFLKLFPKMPEVSRDIIRATK